MKSRRRFVIGDIHGAYRALVQCFEKSGFNREHDLLICLGDVCDSWPEVNKVFDTLLLVKDLVFILGNHDHWALDWFINQNHPDEWLMQGGEATRESYPEEVPENHIRMLKEARFYYRMDRKLFVHGGITSGIPLEKQDKYNLIWDRSLVHTAMHFRNSGSEMNITGFDEVYVGHTPTLNFGQLLPVKACELYMMDTGAGWPDGVLTMMDVDSKEVFQSDVVSNLYPGVKGRI
ncbi:MAG: metallophosphoesterase [Bacteroidales bacterium]|nr:metallophosphoesterase [Bacteroidales bacterium]